MGTKRVVASDEGPGAGASAAETPVAAIANTETTKTKKNFIFDASIVLKFSSFFVVVVSFGERRFFRQ